MNLVDGGGWGCPGRSAKNRIQVIPVQPKSPVVQRPGPAVPDQSDLVWSRSSSKWATRTNQGQNAQKSLWDW